MGWQCSTQGVEELVVFYTGILHFLFFLDKKKKQKKSRLHKKATKFECLSKIKLVTMAEYVQTFVRLTD